MSNRWYLITLWNCLLVPKGIVHYILFPSFTNIFDTYNFYCKIQESVYWVLIHWTSNRMLPHPVLQNPLNPAFLEPWSYTELLFHKKSQHFNTLSNLGEEICRIPEDKGLICIKHWLPDDCEVSQGSLVITDKDYWWQHTMWKNKMWQEKGAIRR